MTRLIALSLALIALAACETTKGAGRDLQKVGGALSNAATEVQQTF